MESLVRVWSPLNGHRNARAHFGAQLVSVNARRSFPRAIHAVAGRASRTVQPDVRVLGPQLQYQAHHLVAVVVRDLLFLPVAESRLAATGAVLGDQDD
jgi:hypothetical protein